MADLNSNGTLSTDEMVYRLYDAQALIKCAMAVLDEDKDDDVIRVLRQAIEVTDEVANNLDGMSETSPEVLAIVEQIRASEGPTAH